MKFPGKGGGVRGTKGRMGINNKSNLINQRTHPERGTSLEKILLTYGYIIRILNNCLILTYIAYLYNTSIMYTIQQTRGFLADMA